MSAEDYSLRVIFDADAPSEAAYFAEVSDASGKPLVVSVGCSSMGEAIETGKTWIKDREGA